MPETELQLALQHILRDGVEHVLGTGKSFSGAIPLEHPQENRGDYASPVAFALAKLTGGKPDEIAKDLVKHLQLHLGEHTLTLLGKKWSALVVADRIEQTGPFVNIWLSKEFLLAHAQFVLAQKEKFGRRTMQKPETVIVEYSSPNIGRPFSIGNLRSTVIGDALARLIESQGHTVVRLNYPGDWGTQFGKLITAYKRWADLDAMKKNAPLELQRVYVKFHDEAAKNPELIEEARGWFSKLEKGDAEALELWKSFRESSLEAYKKIWDLLGVEFDEISGESFYRDKLVDVLKLLESKGLLTASKGAQIIDLTEEGLPPVLMQKTDEGSLYATREVAAAIDRHERFHFDRMLYEVGIEQELHFKQLFAVLRRLKFDWAGDRVGENGAASPRLEHIRHGLYAVDGKKMSTRAGRSTNVDDLLAEAISRAEKVIAEKNPDLPNKKEVARQVGIGAVKYHDLSQQRLHNIEFDLDRMLSLEGNSAPYLQYTYARIKSILRKAAEAGVVGAGEHGTNKKNELEGAAAKLFMEPEELILARRIVHYPEVVAEATAQRLPHLISTELYELASRFNLFYGKVQVLKSEEPDRSARLLLAETTAQVLKNGLELLGIDSPEAM